jgi:hypothetical protein
MIIGFSGKKQHGKDTAATMWAYFQARRTSKTEHLMVDYDYYKKLNITPNSYKFADKLKDIVCLIIGCTREDLENEEFKNAPLGDEWSKTNVFDTFVGTHGQFTEFVKNNDVTISNRPSYRVGGEGEFKYCFYFIWNTITLTPRKLLQLTGTEFGRELVHPDIWVNSTLNSIDDDEYALITDVRFPNEVDAILKRNGIVIRIDRPSMTSNDSHLSETALDKYNFEHRIVNNGTLEKLFYELYKLYMKIS